MLHKRHFQMQILGSIIFVFEFKLRWHLFKYPIDGICLGNDLAPNKRHATTWTDYDHDP